MDLPLYYASEYCCFQDYRDRGFIMYSLAKALAFLKVRQIGKLMPSQCSVLLDYGCGNGSWLRMIKEYNPPWKLIGTDICREALDRLKQDGIEAFVCDDENVFDFVEKNSVGVIHLFHVIEHVPSPMRLLEVLYELLVPGGVIIGQTPNTNCLESRLWKDYWTQWHVPRHFVLFDQQSLRRHAEKTGFEVIQIKNSLSAATHWSLSFSKRRALKKGRYFKMVQEPLYPPLLLAALPIAMLQMLFGIKNSHQDFIFRKPR